MQVMERLSCWLKIGMSSLITPFSYLFSVNIPGLFRDPNSEGAMSVALHPQVKEKFYLLRIPAGRSIHFLNTACGSVFHQGVNHLKAVICNGGVSIA